MGKWLDELNGRPEFSEQVVEPPALIEARRAMQAKQREEGSDLVSIAGLQF